MPTAAGGFPFDFDPEMFRMAREAARQFEAFRAMGLTPFTRMHEQLRQAAESARLYQEYTAHFALSPGVQRMVEEQRQFVQNLNQFARPLQEMMVDLDRSLLPWRRSALELAQSAALNALRDSWTRTLIPHEHLMASLAEPFDALFEAEPEALPERVASIEDVLKAKVKASLPSESASLAWLGIILSLVLFLLDRADSSAANEQNKAFLQSELRQMEQRLVVEIQKNAPTEISPDVLLYIVKRNAIVKATPRSQGQRTGTVYADQLVSSLTATGRWVRITYLDINAGTSAEGWVMKKYLERVPRH